jgi:hypothetical protein
MELGLGEGVDEREPDNSAELMEWGIRSRYNRSKAGVD